MSNLLNQIQGKDSMTYPPNFKEITDIQRIIDIKVELESAILRLEELDANVEQILAAGELVQEGIQGLENYVQMSMDWAIKLGGTVDDVEYSAKHYANLVATAKLDIDAKHLDIGTWNTNVNAKHQEVINLTSETEDYKDEAKDWASKLSTPVAGGNYSAKYYAALVSAMNDNVNNKHTDIGNWNTNVNTKHGEAQTFRDEASQFKNESKDWATKPTIVEGSLKSAKSYSEDSAQFALKAEDWAQAAPNSPVETGKYSARHWASMAEAIYNDLSPILQARVKRATSCLDLPSTDGEVNDICIVNGYRARIHINDVQGSSFYGGGIFKCVASLPLYHFVDNGLCFNAPNGRFWIRVLDGPINPFMFGAVGDGITDDTDAVRMCFINSANKVVDGLGFDYAINSNARVPANDPYCTRYGPRKVDDYATGTIDNANEFISNPIGFGDRSWFTIPAGAKEIKNFNFKRVGSNKLNLFFGARQDSPLQNNGSLGRWFVGQHVEIGNIYVDGDIALTGWYNKYSNIYTSGSPWFIAHLPKNQNATHSENDSGNSLLGNGFYYNTISNCRFERRAIFDTRYGSTNANTFVSCHFRSGIDYRNTGSTGFAGTVGERSSHGNTFIGCEIARSRRIWINDGKYKGGYYSVIRRDNVRFGGLNHFTNSYLEGGISADGSSDPDMQTTARGRFYGDGFVADGMQTASMTDTWYAGNMGLELPFGSGASELTRGIPLFYPSAILDVGGDWSVVDHITQRPPCYSISGGSTIIRCNKGVVPDGYTSIFNTIGSTAYLDTEPCRSNKAILVRVSEQKAIKLHPDRFENDNLLKSYAIIYKKVQNASISIATQKRNDDFNGANGKTLNTIYGSTVVYLEDGWEMLTGMSHGEITFYLNKANPVGADAIMLISVSRVCKGAGLISPSMSPVTVVTGNEPAPKLTRLVGLRFSIVRDSGSGEYVIVSPDIYPTSSGNDYVPPEIFLDETGTTTTLNLTPVKEIIGLGSAGAGRLYIKASGLSNNARFMYGVYREPNNDHSIVMTNWGAANVFINIRNKSNGASQNPTGAILFELYFNVPA